MKMAESARNVVIAVLIGIFMMMPGVSGATLAVVFGVYDRIVRDLSKPAKYLREDPVFIVTIVAVGILGAYLCIKGLDFLIDRYEIPLMFFFATAITIQLPDIYRQAGEKEKATPFNLLALAVGFGLMILVLWVNTAYSGWEMTPSVPAMLLAGVVYGVCILSPGISGSTVLLALGLFAITISSLSHLDFGAILPLFAGAAVGILLFAKVVDHFLITNRRSSYFVIIGLTAGSVVAVAAEAVMKMGEEDITLQIVIAVVAGILLGYSTHMFSRYCIAAQASEAQQDDDADRGGDGES